MKIRTLDNRFLEVELPEKTGSNLLALPALIDPHVHLRVPGSEYKEDWRTGAAAALAGGYATVLDMPNNNPPVIDAVSLENKKQIIDGQLREAGLPLRYELYFGATPDNLKEFEKVKDKIAAVKTFMGASTGNLLVDKKEDLEKIFAEAARLDILVAVHAEDETEIQQQKNSIKSPVVADHSTIRSRAAAIKAVKLALELAEKFGTKLYLCHVSTSEEIGLITEAKNRGLKIYAEVTPHHLFLNEKDYGKLGTLGQMNPPLRTARDNQSLWQAINDGIIDTIGTDHAPHTLEEKSKPYPSSPSGVPGLETCLPLLLNACHQGKISLKKIVKLTGSNPRKIFNLPRNEDWTIVDLNLEKEVKNENLKTKCGWSPFAGWKLKGFPVAMIINNKIIKI